MTPDYAIEWHGYDFAIPADQVARRDADTITTHDGRTFNVHPRVGACGGPEWNTTLIECAVGAYPVRWEVTS